MALEKAAKKYEKEARTNKYYARYFCAIIFLLVLLIGAAGVLVWSQEQKIRDLNSQIQTNQFENSGQQEAFTDTDEGIVGQTMDGETDEDQLIDEE